MFIKLSEDEYFGELDTGDVFTFNTSVYMKIEEENGMNAVLLGDRTVLAHFMDSTHVTPYKNSELTLIP